MQDLAGKARAALGTAKDLGFDTLNVAVARKQLLGVRIAQGTVCRENVWRESESLLAAGTWQGRQGKLEAALGGLDARATLAGLRRELAGQAPDKEHVPPAPPRGSLRWAPARGSFEEQYAPERVYPAIERHAARVRQEGLRLTGYLEARATELCGETQAGFALETQDHGVVLTATVDDPRTGAVGTTHRAALGGEDLDAMIAATVDEAAATCRTSAGPAMIEPGDYTVVLHPAAVLDLCEVMLWYEIFDRRKVDEGRTYLAKARHELRFPEHLRLEQTLALPLPGGGVYADLPLNDRLTPCDGLTMIGDGRVRDLHTSAAWAARSGQRETFSVMQAPPLALRSTAPTHADLDALIKDTERGVLMLNAWYLRIVAEMDGMFTGMTRDGLYEIEDGKIGRPLVNMRWHENPLAVLARASGVTAATRLFGHSRLAGQGRHGLSAMPALRVDGFHFSSATKF